MESETVDIKDILKDITTSADGKAVVLAGKDLSYLPKEIHAKVGGAIESLDLSWNKISTIDNLDKFPNLKSIILDNNNISSVAGLPFLKQLETLSLNNNQIDDLESFLGVITKKCPNLKYLSLIKNPACPNEFTGSGIKDYQRYRFIVLYNLPNLKFLDSRQVLPKEKAEATKRGKFLQVAKPDYEALQKKAEQEKKKAETSPASPALSQQKDTTNRPASPPKAATQSYFGYTKHQYTGKHSEGNRFIKNTDL